MSTAVAVGAGWESSVRAAEPSPTPRCWSAQESRRLSCLLGNTSETRKREIYEVPQKTAKIAKKNLEYLAAKKSFFNQMFLMLLLYATLS